MAGLRILQPTLDGQRVSAAKARQHVREKVVAGKAIGIGSPRASLEANFALRSLVGPEHFHTGMADDEARLVQSMVGILRRGPMRSGNPPKTARPNSTAKANAENAHVAPWPRCRRRRIKNPAMAAYVTLPNPSKMPGSTTGRGNQRDGA